MPKFKVEFRRRVVTWDTVSREIEAPNAKAAADVADAMGWEFNSACPDDAAEAGAPECGDWRPESVKAEA